MDNYCTEKRWAEVSCRTEEGLERGACFPQLSCSLTEAAQLLWHSHCSLPILASGSCAGKPPFCLGTRTTSLCQVQMPAGTSLISGQNSGCDILCSVGYLILIKRHTVWLCLEEYCSVFLSLHQRKSNPKPFSWYRLICSYVLAWCIYTVIWTTIFHVQWVWVCSFAHIWNVTK